MGRAIKERLATWIERWGFAALVAFAALMSASVAATVAMPSEIPSFALKARPVYRLETGAATFTGLYLLALALVLAQGLTGEAERRASVKEESTIAQMEKAIERLERGEAD